MKIIILILALVLNCLAQNVSELTAYNYHERVGIPRARSIKLSEATSPRIVGGAQAALGTFYYQAGLLISLTRGGQSICGGSLLSTTRVLTAAHCWWDGQNQGKAMTVVLGSLKVFSGGTRVLATSVVVHPTWNPQDITHDVAMVKFPAITYTNNIKAIPLPSAAEAASDFAGLTGTASGYGKTKDGQSVTPSTATLYYKDLSIISNSVCQKRFDFPLHGSHLCTDGAKGVGTCDGDSGGPLTVTRSASRVLVGVASFGLGSGCQRGDPSVYSRVTAFLPWIRANL
ncbi:LOW QUALITY PROTEIN: collagenase [Plutella xylostella]|uniref:LOW QUALITY PROTEIN: collagenase n=1 Tax=Plutella xylostella TaxID=51655 RepID=UPI002032630A|nr:LOW QUALITY PROTEIN: collagenase [Plutella xylostella]